MALKGRGEFYVLAYTSLLYTSGVRPAASLLGYPKASFINVLSPITLDLKRQSSLI